MNTYEKDKCKRCGAVIRRESTEKLCPACLMSGAMEPPGVKFETGSMAPGESLALFGPSELPCEFGGYRLLGLLGRGDIQRSFPLLDEILPGPAVYAGCRKSRRPELPGTPLMRLKGCRFPVFSKAANVCPGQVCAIGSATWRRNYGTRQGIRPCPPS